MSGAVFSPVVKVSRGFRYRLAPTPEQAALCEQFAGVSRLAYNLALEQRREFWRAYRRAEGRNISFASQCREVTLLRAEHDWIAAVPFEVLTYALRDLDRAYTAFFAGRADFPRFRRKGDRDGFRHKGREVRVRRLNAKWGEIRLPKIGWVKLRLTRDHAGEIRNAQVTRSADGWHVALSCQWEAASPEPALAQVGIDRGVAQTLTLSTGEHLQAPVAAAKQIARARKVLARKRRGSKRYAAQRVKLSRLTARAARQRTDFCHKASRSIADRFGLVAIEGLNIPNMTSAGRGKRGLNRSILEQSWGKFADCLDYKLTERGGQLITVPAAYTSQTCASCGAVDARSRESQAVFRCVACGHTDNADVNAAKEILRRSTAWLDVEAGVARPAKRQPEESQHV